MDVLRFALESIPPTADELPAWWSATAAARACFPTTIDRAIAGGALADRLGFAFASGYAEALRNLVPGTDGITALCATEEGGNHPRAIRTTFAGGRVNGRKTWSSFAPLASHLIVIASAGVAPDGRNRLVAVRVAASAPGIRFHPSHAAFVPEIPHAEVELVDVPVTDELPGDGYDTYLKPFRTVEDVHVHGALLGYLLGVTRRHALAPSLTEQLLALATATRHLSDPTSPTTHRTLAGVIDLVTATVTSLEAAWVTPSPELARWQRDRRLLQVAGKARAARLAKARTDT